MRLRQIALVARELSPVVEDLCAVLGIEVGFNDPGVGYFGLNNAVMPMGDCFLEVISPEREGTTAGRYLDRMSGDCGYMVILQSDDLDTDRKRIDELGVRIVWSTELDDIRAMHLHPRDTGGALCSIDQPVPPESWRWGGPDWQSKVRTDVCQQLVGGVLQCDDPEKRAARYAEVFGQRLEASGDGCFEIKLDGSVLRFEEAQDDRGDCLSAIEIRCESPERVIETAQKRGLETQPLAVKICGTWLRLV